VTDHITDENESLARIPATQPEGRSAKKAQTRRQLIDAASEVMAERGFHDASLMEVASRAGLTTGAVYSNFRSKEDLILAVIQETSLPFDLGPETWPLWQRLGHAAVRAARGTDLPDTRRVFKLQLELALMAMGEPALKLRFADDMQTDRQFLAALLTTPEPAPAPAFSPTREQLATAVIATLQGLTQHRFLDPEAVPEELAVWAVQALLHVASTEAATEADVHENRT
jgi:AcrR family transcriptional regulator